MKHSLIRIRARVRKLKVIAAAVDMGKLEQQIAKDGIKRLHEDLEIDVNRFIRGWQEALAGSGREEAAARFRGLRVQVTTTTSSSSSSSNSLGFQMLIHSRDGNNNAAVAGGAAGTGALMQQQQQQQHEIAAASGTAARN
jgi:hypothetical protein